MLITEKDKSLFEKSKSISEKKGNTKNVIKVADHKTWVKKL